MKVLIYIERDTALLAGISRYGEVVVEFDPGLLCMEQREELTHYGQAVRGSQVIADFNLASNLEGTPSLYRDMACVNNNSLPLLLDRLIAHRKKEEEEKKALHEEKVKQLLKGEDEDWFEISTWNCKAEIKVKCQDGRLNEKMEFMKERAKELVNSLIAAKEETDRKNREYRAKVEQEEKERKEREAQSIANFKEWALKYGSPLLQARIKGEYEWYGLATEEFKGWLAHRLKVQDKLVTDQFAQEEDLENMPKADEPTLAQMEYCSTFPKSDYVKDIFPLENSRLVEVCVLMPNAEMISLYLDIPG